MTETPHRLIARLRNPPFGTETSERNLMAAAAACIEAALVREVQLARRLDTAQKMLTTYQTANANNLALQVSANAELTAAIEREAALLVALRYYSEGTGDMGEVARNAIRDAT